MISGGPLVGCTVVKQIEEIISNQGAAALFHIFYSIAEFLGLCLRPDLIGYFGHSLRVPLKSGTRSLRQQIFRNVL